VGEIHVVEKMIAEDAVIAVREMGGDRPRVGFVRDSFVGMALVLDLMAKTGEPLSRLSMHYRDLRWSRRSIPWPAIAWRGWVSFSIKSLRHMPTRGPTAAMG